MNARRASQSITGRYAQLRIARRRAISASTAISKSIRPSGDLDRNRPAGPQRRRACAASRARRERSSTTWWRWASARSTPIGFCGDDGEGYELRRALAAMPGVNLEYFVETAQRRTFTYCKPLVVEPASRRAN